MGFFHFPLKKEIERNAAVSDMVRQTDSSFHFKRLKNCVFFLLKEMKKKKNNNKKICRFYDHDAD